MKFQNVSVSLSVLSFSLVSLLVSCFAPVVLAQEGYIVVERHSKRVLLAANSEQVVKTGSFSQLATAKVALDWAKLSGTKLSTLMVVPEGVSYLAISNSLKLQAGDQISMRDALYSVSLNQDGVSALVLADHVGKHLLAKRGRSGSSYDAFTAEMNNLASHLKMNSTRFSSPAGGLGKTKISDLAKLASYALQKEGYDFYMKQKTRTVTVRRLSGQTQKLNITNTNQMLGTMSISGLMVEGANAVIAANKGNVVKRLANGGAEITPRQLVVVNFGAVDRNARAKQLIAAGWKVYGDWRMKGFPMSATGNEFLR